VPPWAGDHTGRIDDTITLPFGTRPAYASLTVEFGQLDNRSAEDPAADSNFSVRLSLGKHELRLEGSLIERLVFDHHVEYEASLAYNGAHDRFSPVPTPGQPFGRYWRLERVFDSVLGYYPALGDRLRARTVLRNGSGREVGSSLRLFDLKFDRGLGFAKGSVESESSERPVTAELTVEQGWVKNDHAEDLASDSNFTSTRVHLRVTAPLPSHYWEVAREAGVRRYETLFVYKPADARYSIGGTSLKNPTDLPMVPR
jgi:hypothetical protein